MPNHLRIGLTLIIAIILFLELAPEGLLDVLHNLLALWSLGLLIAAVATLAWFLYWFFLRRIIRARRIANARLKRILREQMERGSDEPQP